MFATMGYIAPEYFKFPGFLAPSLDLKFADVPSGLKALNVVPAAGWAQIVAFCGFLELVYNKPTGEPGNYGKGNLGLGSIGLGGSVQDPTLRAKKLNAELANGRLAMFAIIGMFFQDGLTGSAWADWALYTASPLRAFEGELGIQAPVGFWDPLGYTADGDVVFFRRRRETELKHGRIAMFACMGYITPEYFKFPGYLSPKMGLQFADIPNGLAALSKVPGQGWFQIVAFLGCYELFINKPVGNEVGNYGKGNLGLGLLGPVKDPESRKKKLSAELANGRLAMMAIIGMFFQDGLTGSAWGDWALYTGSPLRAFEGELGIQAPIGFWDPLGYTADGDVVFFRRRRETELKHGRIAMFACMGYITPEYFKFPGYLSPKMGLQFADIPNGLAALSKVPGQGWFQIVAFLGCYELFINKPVGNEVGNYGKGNLGLGLLGPVKDPESRKKKLSAELANGRLAMMAIIGMFFQDGLTGSAWGDWALYTASPLRAFESETGIQPPVGFWDPLGLAASGNAADFKRRREVELKHGRVSMFATIGYIVPEYFRIPGNLSNYQGIKFAELPNGLAALSKVPSLGWFQIVGFAGLTEVMVYNKEENNEPGNYGAGFLGLRTVGIMNTGIQEPDLRKKKLNTELANGRLAMMAIMGMLFQDGLTGSAWGDWALYTASPLR
ncbi:unnamed protein product [Polarella glacialis]|nr:unnamed protein product [Polarella glacialis]